MLPDWTEGPSVYAERAIRLAALLGRLKRGGRLNGTSGLVKSQNALRRERGRLWMVYQEMRAGVPRLPREGREYRDSYPAVTLERGSRRGRNRRVRVFDWKGHVLKESGVLVLEPRFDDRFWRMGSHLWVEPHPGYPGSWQLVGEYNFRDERIE